jgi:hypothetical protein
MRTRLPQTLTLIAITYWGIPHPGESTELGQPPSSGSKQNQSTQQSKSIPSQSPTGTTGPSASGSSASGSSSPRPSGSGTSTAATKRAALVKLLSSPDNTVVTVDGKSISAGQLRKGIRSYSSGLKKIPRVSAARSVSAPGNSPSTLTSQNRSLLAALQQAVSSSSGSGGSLRNASMKSDAAVPGTHGTLASSQKSSAAADISKPCPQRIPYIAEMKGSLTPGGMITFEGTCLGTTPGEVRIYGDFANGFVRLQVQMWADGGVAATVPADLTGVLDQSARLEVIRADQQVSNDRKAAFVATRATLQVPATLVQLVTCTDYANDCADDAASHVSTDGDDGSSGQRFGTDAWQVTVGNGWSLQNLAISDEIGSTTATGFDQGQPNTAAFNIQWVGGVLSSTTYHATFWDLVGSTETTYLASYSFSVSAVGPAGVSPDPRVKPPYAGHAVTTGSSITAVAEKPDRKPPPPSPIQNVAQETNRPVWNTIIGNGGGGINPSARNKASQLQGQPTAVPAGAPVESPQ